MDPDFMENEEKYKTLKKGMQTLYVTYDVEITGSAET